MQPDSGLANYNYGPLNLYRVHTKAQYSHYLTTEDTVDPNIDELAVTPTCQNRQMPCLSKESRAVQLETFLRCTGSYFYYARDVDGMLT